jgi:surface carbohydrate biosynthesis protein
MKKKIIFLPIESFKRDALSRVYLANKLCNNDPKIEVIIGHPEILLNVILPSIKNAIWLGRFISLSGDSDADKRLISKLKKQKCKMYYLHDEGAFYADDNYNEALEMLHNPVLLNQNYVKYVLVWGEYQKKYLSRLIELNKILVSGMYRFDLLKLKSTYSKKIYNGKSYILINTRFPESNLLKGEVGIFDKRTLQHYLSANITKELAIDDMFTVWSVISESFSVFIFAIYKLISQNKDILFVIRPHPVESPKFYQEAFGFFDNVLIDNNVNISEQIYMSDLVIHNQCTTGVESVIAGKPTINFVPTIRKNIVGTSNSGTVVTNYNDLLQVFSLFKTNNYEYSENEENDYLKNVDPSFMTSDFLIDILNQEQIDSVQSWFNLYFKWDFNKLKTVIKFSFFVPILQILKVKHKHSQYSISALKKYNYFNEVKNIYFKFIFNCLVTKKVK